MTDGAVTPTAWRVTAVADKPRLDGHKAKPWAEDYAEQASALERKRDLQEIGHVATVTPVYMTRREHHYRACQFKPFGDFRERWKLHA